MTLQINYQKLINQSLKSAIKELLKNISKDGLPGEHHFYISFITKHPGIIIPDWMVEKYPDKMTIVIQNWFDNLIVNDQSFEIVLNFKNKPENLTISFDSILTFSDPSVNFSLQFDNPIIQNLETLKDEKTKEKNLEQEDIQKISYNTNIEKKPSDNVIQFKNFKKVDK